MPGNIAMRQASDSTLTDQIAIEELVHRYCDALCERNRDSWVATFAEDGIWDVGRGPVVGMAALAQSFDRIMELFDHVLQLTHNGECHVSGEQASGRWYITEYGLTAKGRRTFYIGHYDDTYVRTAEGWRFARRLATWHYHGLPDLSGTFAPHQAMRSKRLSRFPIGKSRRDTHGITSFSANVGCCP